jgi:hypothetical protein
LYTKLSLILSPRCAIIASLETLIGYFSAAKIARSGQPEDDWNHMPHLTRILASALIGLGIGISAPAHAEQRPVVVELFTSQGCSSCPPADAMFEELQERDDVIAIALHVDYWDYIGWKDEFGQPAHAERQRAYAARAGRRSIYTPEMLVNGQTDIVGARPMQLSKAIAEHKARAPRVDLAAQRDGGSLHVQGKMLSAQTGVMDIHVLRLTPRHTSEITRGENRGKTYEYTNIAHNWQVAGQWDGQAPLDLTLELTGADPVVVLVQEAGAGAIIGAVQVD